MKYTWLFLLGWGILHGMEPKALRPAPDELLSNEKFAAPPLPKDPDITALTLNAELAPLQSAYSDLLSHEPEVPEWHLSPLDQAGIAAGLASALVIADRQADSRFVLTDTGYTPWIVAGITSLWQFLHICYYRFGRWRARVNNAEMQDIIKKNLGPRLTTLEKNVRELTQNTNKRLESTEKKVSTNESATKSLQTEIFKLAKDIDDIKKQLKKK